MKYCYYLTDMHLLYPSHAYSYYYCQIGDELQLKAIDIANEGKNLFLTGKAGYVVCIALTIQMTYILCSSTKFMCSFVYLYQPIRTGKSWATQRIVKCFDKNDKVIYVTAPTGMCCAFMICAFVVLIYRILFKFD